MPPSVKVCCIASREEAQTAVEAGASALGLVSRMPSGPGVISEERIREIAEAVPPRVATFLLTSLTDAGAIVEQQRRCRTSTIQLCDRLTESAHAALREALPELTLVQVVHVESREAVDEACRVESWVDVLLLDSGRPRAAVKELGGTGRVHDWLWSRTIRGAVSVPVFLAGGLRPDNVAQAIQTVRPYGVDVCTGLRTRGRLDTAKLRAFMSAVHSTG